MMHIAWRIAKDWTFPIAMAIGALAYTWISRLAFLTSGLIFLMLLLTFCNLSPRELHFRPEHLKLLIVQLTLVVFTFIIFSAISPVVGQGALICVLAPTATAAAVITGMLGGSVAYITTYLLLINTCVALLAPLCFSLIGPHSDMPFWTSLFLIGKKIVPILIFPLLLAWLLQKFTPKVHKVLVRYNGASFYLWAISLTIVTANTVKFLVEQPNPDYRTEILLAASALTLCILQFWIGRRIGKGVGDPVSSGQALGQKNTILAIWMSQVFLNPVSSVAPAAYVLWQNIINTYQLLKKQEQ